MWLLMNDGFVSVVADRQYSDMLVVRARRQAHLKSLLPGNRIVKTKHTDYRWRCFVTRERFAKLIANRIETISYPNFKNSVPDDDLHDLYARFWSDGLRFQNMPPAKKRKPLPRTHSKFYDNLFNK